MSDKHGQLMADAVKRVDEAIANASWTAWDAPLPGSADAAWEGVCSDGARLLVVVWTENDIDAGTSQQYADGSMTRGTTMIRMLSAQAKRAAELARKVPDHG